MRWTSSAIVVTAAISLYGCGSSDPTGPSEVRVLVTATFPELEYRNSWIQRPLYEIEGPDGNVTLQAMQLPEEGEGYFRASLVCDGEFVRKVYELQIQARARVCNNRKFGTCSYANDLASLKCTTEPQRLETGWRAGCRPRWGTCTPIW